MASDINTGTAPCSNTAAAIDCLSPLVAIRLCDSLETAQPMLNTTLAIHLTSKKVDAFAFVTHRLIQGYRFRVGPYRFCGASNPTTHSILLWSYLILSDAHMFKGSTKIHPRRHLTSSYPNGWISAKAPIYRSQASPVSSFLSVSLRPRSAISVVSLREKALQGSSEQLKHHG